MQLSVEPAAGACSASQAKHDRLGLHWQEKMPSVQRANVTSWRRNKLAQWCWQCSRPGTKPALCQGVFFNRHAAMQEIMTRVTRTWLLDVMYL